jgi:hypothetical protein
MEAMNPLENVGYVCALQTVAPARLDLSEPGPTHLFNIWLQKAQTHLK